MNEVHSSVLQNAKGCSLHFICSNSNCYLVVVVPCDGLLKQFQSQKKQRYDLIISNNKCRKMIWNNLGSGENETCVDEEPRGTWDDSYHGMNH